MKILIQNGRVMDPARGLDQICDVAVAAGRVVSIGQAPAGFEADRVVDASGLWVLPGLVDLAVRLREPGHEHEGMLQSEMAASVAGGVTSLVCLPDTEPVLDEQGLVEMLKLRAENLHQSRLFPMGALTKGLQGEVLTEMAELTESGCVAFGQADVPLPSITTLSRAMSYANTFGYAVWLRPQDKDLGKGVAASGALATRMGLSGVPVAAETIALHTIFELIRGSQTRVHLCRISSAAGVELVRKAKAEGLNITADVSINSLHLTENDIGYFDSSARLIPPLRQQRDRDALSGALADGTIDALVSDHCPVDDDAKVLPFAEAEAGATGVELLLSLAVKWSQDGAIPLARALEVVTAAPARVLGGALGTLQASLGQLVEGGVADLCVVNPKAAWTVAAPELVSQGKCTPFNGYEMPARVQLTLVNGHVAFERG
ncbi:MULTISPECIES: dihydroorotase [Comamonas]|uniref:Dihydroorotase n=1 Tax=Comamonas avium TaxID=2762231 RepID=A0ABR8SCW8_9BURK|nr:MULTISPECIES: dihydroorotase [Comamonas]MBD7960959.1 dihydroorotase [Comamonas avium]MBD9400777.1 dihydroorotase [Comamonas sp. CMM02]